MTFVIPKLSYAANVIATIQSDVNNLAVDEKRNKIYALNSDGNALSVIDGSTDSLISPIPIRQGINSLAVNSETGNIYVKKLIQFGSFFGGEQDTVGLFVVDGAQNKDTNTFIEVTNGVSGGLAVDSASNKIFITNVLNKVGMLVIINGASNSVTDNIAISKNPGNIAVDSKNKKLCIAAQDKVDIFDFNTNKLAGSVDVTGVSDGSSITVNPNTNKAYISHGDTVEVINTMSFVAITTLPANTYAGAASGNGNVTGLAVNPKTNKLYIAFDEYISGSDVSTLVVLDGENNTVDDVTKFENAVISRIALNPVTNKIYVRFSDSIKVIEGLPGGTDSSSSSTGGTPSSTSGGTTTSSGGSVFLNNFLSAIDVIQPNLKKIKDLKKGTKDKWCKDTADKVIRNLTKVSKNLKNSLKLPAIFCEAKLKPQLTNFSTELTRFSFLVTTSIGREKPCFDPVVGQMILGELGNASQTVDSLGLADDNENNIKDICEEKNR